MTDQGEWLADERLTDQVHLVPAFPGERVHVCDEHCWCGPRYVGELDDKRVVWSHSRRAEA